MYISGVYHTGHAYTQLCISCVSQKCACDHIYIYIYGERCTYVCIYIYIYIIYMCVNIGVCVYIPPTPHGMVIRGSPHVVWCGCALGQLGPRQGPRQKEHRSAQGAHQERAQKERTGARQERTTATQSTRSAPK